MKRDAYGRLDDNSYPILRRLGHAEPTTPWAIRLTDDNGLYRLLCFDFDGKDSTGTTPELTEQAHDDCTQLSQILDDHHIPHVVCQSSSTRGMHIWIAVRGGAPAQDVADLARSARAVLRTLDHGMLCNPAEGSARPPLSPHRNGSHSTLSRGALDTLITPTVTPDSLNTVTATLTALRPEAGAHISAPSGPIDTTYTPRRPLSKAGHAHMATINGGGNPSWTGFMCLLFAATAGWTFTDIENATRTAPGLEHYRTKNTGRGSRRPRTPHDTHTRLQRQWTKAQTYASFYASLPRAQQAQDFTELENIINDVHLLLERVAASPGRWNTEAGQSRRSILHALAYLTLHTGKRTVAASIRDLALMTGLGRTTASTALTTLQRDGLITRTSAAMATNAAEWRLGQPFSTGHEPVRSQPFNNPRPPTQLFTQRHHLITMLEEPLLEMRQDVFTRSGLGHTAGRIYSQFSTEVVSAAEDIARVIGLGLRQTQVLIGRLQRHKLIKRGPNGWTRPRRDQRLAAAAALGVAGTLAQRALKYQVERETWAELVTMTTPPQFRPKRAHVTARQLVADEGSGERIWPRYPRVAGGRADHKAARSLVNDGALNPSHRFQYLGDAA
jgi:hypothetical protein